MPSHLLGAFPMIRLLAFALAAELESGHHEQTKGFLCRTDGSKCCLGVATWMTPVQFSTTQDNGKYRFETAAGSEVEVLPTEALSYFDFYAPAGRRRDDDRIVFGNHEYGNLAEANDDGVSFRDIAAYIRKNYEFL